MIQVLDEGVIKVWGKGVPLVGFRVVDEIVAQVQCEGMKLFLDGIRIV